jgi:uncharacterized membrane protein
MHALTSRVSLSKLLTQTRRQGAIAMPSFLKNPKFIVSVIVILWVAYIIYNNLQKTVDFYLLPFNVLTLQLRVSAILVGSAIFGAAVTLVIQFFWRRRSKNASSAAAPAASSSTMA